MKKFKFIINGSPYEVSVDEIAKDVAQIEVNGTPFTVEIQKPDKDSPLVVKTPGKVEYVKVPEKTIFAHAIKSPLPGTVSKVLVADGQEVKRGDVLIIMESMKMENNILAEEDGTVKTIRVTAGQSVMQDDVLIDFEGIVIVESTSAKETTQEKSTVVPTRGTIKSPLPGTVLKVAVTVGQKVKRGNVLMTLESMKMENNILAERDSEVKAIHVQTGQSVMQDDPLVDLE